MTGVKQAHASSQSHPVLIPLPDILLEGELAVAKQTKAIVILIDEDRHKSGCRDIAHVLRQHNFSTLIISLLTRDELKSSHTHTLRQDVVLLSQRLQKVTSWVRDAPETDNLMVGYMAFGADAAAAVVNAARHQDIIGAVVTCDGQVNLAKSFLPYIRRPLLLIACGHDPEILAENREAVEEITCPYDLHIIPNVESLFSGPLVVDETARNAALWFDKFLH